MLSLIFAVLLLAYVIHGLQTDSLGSLGCFGDSKPDDNDLILSNINRPINIQQLALQQQLKRIQRP